MTFNSMPHLIAVAARALHLATASLFEYLWGDTDNKDLSSFHASGGFYLIFSPNTKESTEETEERGYQYVGAV